MSEPKRVLLWSPYASWGYHGAIESTIARALQVRGHDVRVFACDAQLNACDVFRETTQPRDRWSCKWCMRTTRKNLVPVRDLQGWLGEFLDPGLRRRLDAWVAGLGPAELLEATWDGRPVGAWALSSALYQFRAVEYDPTHEKMVAITRDMVHAAALSAEALTLLYRYFRPDVVVLLNGRFVSHRVAVELARESGIRYVTYERGFSKHALRLHADRLTHDLRNYEEPWERWGDVPLAEDELERVDRFLHDRRHGRNLSWAPFSPPPREDDDLRAQLDLGDAPVVAVFTSTLGETAVFPEYREGAFPEGRDWLPAVLELATRFPEHRFVLRMHPNLGDVKGMGRSPELDQIEWVAAHLPENCRLVRPGDEVSSYRLADLSAGVLVYASMLGLEMAAEGRDVVAVARGWYGKTGIVRFAQTPADMERELRAMLTSDRIDHERARRAWRFLHAVVAELDLPFRGAAEVGEHDGEVTWAAPEELNKGRDRDLDTLVRVIVEGGTVRPAPTPADRARTTDAEDTWFARRIYGEPEPTPAPAPEPPGPTPAPVRRRVSPPGFDWSNASVLVTGGTGSFGKQLVRTLLRGKAPKRVVVFSRDELKQHEMRGAGYDDPRLRYFIGDVRDEARLRRALQGVDVVVHAAALKQVPACEYNPFEAIQTNILGARNVIETSLDAGVRRVLSLSTDKAVNPVNLYGATKLCAEKLFGQGNAYSGHNETRFANVRYGNVVGSRGSVIPLFRRQRATGTVTLTDDRMTRFWLTLEQGVDFVLRAVGDMQGGETFVPRIPSMRLVDLAEAIAPGCTHEVIGIRPGEKLHEVLVSEDEARNARDDGDRFVILPAFATWPLDRWDALPALPEGFRYTSDTNDAWLSVDELRAMVGE